jgi:hypothetical protein
LVLDRAMVLERAMVLVSAEPQEDDDDVAAVQEA